MKSNTSDKPTLLGISAHSGTGKTTLLTQLIPLLKERGLGVGVIKHTHHDVEVDVPGKDSYELRKAGADETVLVSRWRWALMAESDPQQEPKLQQAVDRLDHSTIDLILVEGFKQEHFPKIELHRPIMEKPLLFPNDPDVVAVITDGALAEETDLPVIALDDLSTLVDFIVSRVGD